MTQPITIEPVTIEARDISKTQAAKIIRSLRAQAILSTWTASTKVLHVHVTKYGVRWTENMAKRAIVASLVVAKKTRRRY